MKNPRLAVLVPISLIMVAVAFVGTFDRRGSGIFISEICPHNDGVVHDSVGFYHDYIVLSNPSDEPVCLEGYMLSDSISAFDRYTFGEVWIDPGEDLLVWADEKKEFGRGFTDEEAEYTGFRLSDNESVFLTDPEGNVADSVEIPAMRQNKALLRGGTGEKGIVGKPGFWETDNPVISDKVTPPLLSAASGYYNEPFMLSVDGGENPVFYTVDGSSPYRSGIRYSEPVPVYDRSEEPDYYSAIGPVSIVFDQYIPVEPVSKAMVVRAVAQRPDGTFSKETTATYFIGEQISDICKGAYTLSIVSDPENLFSGENGIYVSGNTWEQNEEKIDYYNMYEAPANYNMRGKGWDRDARLTLFDPDGNLLFDENDKISIHGYYSRSFVQKGFSIKPEKPEDKVLAGLLKDSGDTLVLKAGTETDAFRTNFRNPLNSRIAKNLSVAAQRSVCCQLYLDGEYWGCYSIMDRLDESFIRARYNIPAGDVNLIKISGGVKGVTGSDSALLQYQELVDYVSGHDLGDDRNYRHFCDMMDIDNLIDYYCAEIYFANEDAYINNVGIWRARDPGSLPYEDGRWRFVLFDLDNTDGFQESSNYDTDSFVEGNNDDNNPDTDLFFSNLSKNKEFRRRFRERFEELISTDFSYETVAPVIDDMEKTYTKPVVLSVRRFGDPGFSEEQYHKEVEIVREFFQKRGEYISKYLMMHMGD